MLILNRKTDQRIIIGDGLVTIVVVEIQPHRVRLGIEADPTLTIHREEVYLDIKSQTERESK